ncbi:MAG: family intrarane metalloprotease [Nocardioidaceae bacterium]|nr:family intrarane metalloprotease [Nocardioidaceae bacterium]
MSTSGAPAPNQRGTSYVAFAGIVIGYLAVIKLIGLLAGHLYDIDDPLTTTKGVLVTMWIPLGAAFLYTYAVIGFLRWWYPVLREEHRTRRWVWVVPITFAVCSLLAIDYGSLGDKTIGYVLALLVATQFVGWGEEGMFRGIGVTTLRAHGLREGQVALWSSVMFGAVHITNALSSGAQAIPQAIAVSFAGYFFYLSRRVSGTNIVNSVLHGLFDFSLLTGTVVLVDQDAYIGSAAAILAYLICAVVVLVRRRTIEPAPA